MHHLSKNDENVFVTYYWVRAHHHSLASAAFLATYRKSMEQPAGGSDINTITANF